MVPFSDDKLAIESDNNTHSTSLTSKRIKCELSAHEWKAITAVFPTGSFSEWHKRLVEEQQTTVYRGPSTSQRRADATDAISKPGESWCNVMCQYYIHTEPIILERWRGARDANDAVANISDVTTAGILLAQK